MSSNSVIVRDLLVSDPVSAIKAILRRLETLEQTHPGRPGVQPGNLVFITEQGIADVSAGGVRCFVSADNVSNPPTAAQADSALGLTAEDVGSGFSFCIHDNGNGTMWAIWSDGADWHAEALTKLV